jgi:hypothetical protein
MVPFKTNLNNVSSIDKIFSNQPALDESVWSLLMIAGMIGFSLLVRLLDPNLT